MWDCLSEQDESRLEDDIRPAEGSDVSKTEQHSLDSNIEHFTRSQRITRISNFNRLHDVFMLKNMSDYVAQYPITSGCKCPLGIIDLGVPYLVSSSLHCVMR